MAGSTPGNYNVAVGRYSLYNNCTLQYNEKAPTAVLQQPPTFHTNHSVVKATY